MLASLFLTFLLVLLNGFFVAAEFAFDAVVLYSFTRCSLL